MTLITKNDRTMPVTVQTRAALPPDRVFEIITPIDLSLVFKGWGPFPAVRGVSNQTGAWDHAGPSRNPDLSDGSTATETLTEYTAGHSFGYELTGFTNVPRRLVQGVRGEWTFTPDGAGTASAGPTSSNPCPVATSSSGACSHRFGAVTCKPASRQPQLSQKRAHAHRTHGSARSPLTAPRLSLIVLVALSLGVLTAYAQEWLPPELNSLTNSSGSWALAAFGLALLSTNARNAALIGCLTLLGLLAGYKLGAEVRGFATGTGLIAFWGAAALLAGPLLGLFAHWVKRGQGLRPAVGIGAMSGVLIGEGVYGLRFIADSTSPVYWWCEILAGVVLGGLVVIRQPVRVRSAAVTAATGILTAAAFVAVYSQDLITAFP